MELRVQREIPFLHSGNNSTPNQAVLLAPAKIPFSAKPRYTILCVEQPTCSLRTQETIMDDNFPEGKIWSKNTYFMKDWYSFEFTKTSFVQWNSDIEVKNSKKDKTLPHSSIYLTLIEIIFLFVHVGKVEIFVDMFHLPRHYYQVPITSRHVDTNCTVTR